MTERETPPVIRTQTEDEMSRQAGFDHKYGFLQASDPEFEPICDRYIDILRQLEGQPKADFFHMRHFRSYDDQAALWSKMAVADEEAANWKTTLDEARAAMWSAYRAELASTEELSQELIQLSLGRLAVHPAPHQKHGEIFGKYEGEYRGEPTIFNLVDSSRDRQPTISIQIPTAAIPFDYKLLETEGYQLAGSMRHHLKYEAEKKGCQLAQTAEILSFNNHGGTKYLVIDNAGSPPNSFARANPLNYGRLPMELPTRDDEYSLSSKSIEELIEMVKTAHPVVAKV